MDTSRIRYFLTFAKIGSVTKAAEIHHITPAAFSKAMRVFEGELGFPLTVPNGRGVLLTDRAQTLVPELTEIIRKLDVVLNQNSEVQHRESQKPLLRLATFEVFSTHFLERALSTSLSDCSCEVREMIPGQMENAVAKGVSDFALTYLPIPHADLDYLRIASIGMGIYGLHSSKSIEDFRDLPFAVPMTPVESSPTRVQGLDGWPDDTFPRLIRYKVEMLETALGLCRKGLAYAYIPKFIAQLHNETVKDEYALKEVVLPKHFKKQNQFIYLVKRKTDIEGALAKKIARAVRNICSI